MISGETGGELADATHALAGLSTAIDHLIKVVADRGLEVFDDPDTIQFLHLFEQLRNRLPLIDHQLVAEINRRDLATSLCQGSAQRVLTATLLIAKSEAARRVRAADAVGPRVRARRPTHRVGVHPPGSVRLRPGTRPWRPAPTVR